MAVKTLKQAEKDLKAAGFVKKTGKGAHGVYWVNEATGVKVPLQNHGKDLVPAVAKGVAAAIAKAAELA